MPYFSPSSVAESELFGPFFQIVPNCQVGLLENSPGCARQYLERKLKKPQTETELCLKKELADWTPFMSEEILKLYSRQQQHQHPIIQSINYIRNYHP